MRKETKNITSFHLSPNFVEPNPHLTNQNKGEKEKREKLQGNPNLYTPAKYAQFGSRNKKTVETQLHSDKVHIHIPVEEKGKRKKKYKENSSFIKPFVTVCDVTYPSLSKIVLEHAKSRIHNNRNSSSYRIYPLFRS